MTDKSKKILVVDDDPLVLWLVDHALSADGFCVITAHDGVEALNRIGECKTPVLMALIDVVMPGMNGKELASQLLSTHPAIKILYMSGYGADTVYDAMQGQKLHFLQKPFDFERLLMKVREEFDSPASARPQASD